MTGVLKKEAIVFIVSKKPLKEPTTTMTTAFTGRLQFTGKKVGSTPAKRGFRLFTLDRQPETTLLRCINKRCTPWNLTI